MEVLTRIIFLTLFCYTAGLSGHEKLKFDPASQLFDLHKDPANKQIVRLTNVGFDWQDCGAASNVAHLQSLTLSPAPMRLPGNVNLSFAATVQRLVQAPIKAVVQLWRKVVFWIQVPCVDNLGSCTYNDICTILSHVKCPPIFASIGLPCQCPINMGGFKLPTSSIYIDDSKVAKFVNGEYKARISLYDAKGGVLCLYLHFTIV